MKNDLIIYNFIKKILLSVLLVAGNSFLSLEANSQRMKKISGASTQLIKQYKHKSTWKKQRKKIMRGFHILITVSSITVIIYLVYKNYKRGEGDVTREIVMVSDPFTSKPTMTEHQVLTNIDRLIQVHQLDDDEECRCHNSIFEKWHHKIRLAYSYRMKLSARTFRFKPHHLKWGCDICNNDIAICYYAKGVACWHCANYELHEDYKGFHVCRECVARNSKNCEQCCASFSKVLPTDDDHLCPSCVGYNSLIAARDKILEKAGVTIKGLPVRMDYQQTGNSQWLLISKKIEDLSTIAALTNQVKLFKDDYVYPKDASEWEVDKLRTRVEEASGSHEPGDSFEEFKDLLATIHSDHIIICPSYDYVWGENGKPPISYQEKIFGLINSYEENGRCKTYFFMLCGYTYRS